MTARWPTVADVPSFDVGASSVGKNRLACGVTRCVGGGVWSRGSALPPGKGGY